MPTRRRSKKRKKGVTTQTFIDFLIDQSVEYVDGLHESEREKFIKSLPLERVDYANPTP